MIQAPTPRQDDRKGTPLLYTKCQFHTKVEEAQPYVGAPLAGALRTCPRPTINGRPWLNALGFAWIPRICGERVTIFLPALAASACFSALMRRLGYRASR